MSDKVKIGKIIGTVAVFGMALYGVLQRPEMALVIGVLAFLAFISISLLSEAQT